MEVVGVDIPRKCENSSDRLCDISANTTQLVVADSEQHLFMGKMVRDDGKNDEVVLVLHDTIDVTGEANCTAKGEGIEEADVGMEVDLVVVLTTIIHEHGVGGARKDVVGREVKRRHCRHDPSGDGCTGEEGVPGSDAYVGDNDALGIHVFVIRFSRCGDHRE